MKKGILFLLIATSLVAGAQQKQSLKDLLYSGKLKLDSTAVIRKDDDLASKIDTSTRKAAEPEKPKPAAATNEPAKPAVVKSDAANTATAEPVASTETTVTPPAVATPAKSNTKILKDYTDSLVSTLKTELLPSKKIKKDTYYLVAEYEIGTDGQVSILGVTSTPENTFLQDEVKSRMGLTAPQLAPVLDSTGKARKVKRKASFTVTKE